MTTTELHDPTLDETVHKCVLPCGLTAYVVHKPAFTRSYATIGTRYGSVDTHLGPRRQGAPIPDGTAHFLEHKMFEMPGGDAFDRFAARGASANAYTSFTHTQYLFGTSTEYEANLETLFDLVLDLHVDEENVEKEKGIIGQEIAMYDDDPDWRLYFGALQALYKRHPVRIDIAGTRDTIDAITPELLHDVHRTYYHPRNLVLAAVSPEPVATTIGVEYGRENAASAWDRIINVGMVRKDQLAAGGSSAIFPKRGNGGKRQPRRKVEESQPVEAVSS